MATAFLVVMAATMVKDLSAERSRDLVVGLRERPWVNFAIEKRVKRLELHFYESGEIKERYNFPDTDRITNHLHSLSLGFTRFNSLTNLLLTDVKVTGQALEDFLTNCPFLEQLSMKKSECLVNLKVPYHSLNLKRLEIIYCFNVESTEISAMNLVSFKYFGPKISQPFKMVKQLVELFIGGEYCNYLINNNFFDISSHLAQLESLTLHMTSIELESYKQDLKKIRRSFASRPHQYLKVVELIGFVGRTNDVELAMYLIKNTVMFEKITFDSRKPNLIGTPWEFRETKEKKIARKRAENFRTKLLAGAALVIL
ncbi:uncharacterized protein LOC132305312 [Cornus florida]|uniref:uncharacterized protein LOC132305312 n=1 Tax=Cornus florida TaxID=4283 RepID=UPI00289D68C6|nr:uncharacterized protein LOC132305312 [Cornus florida]